MAKKKAAKPAKGKRVWKAPVKSQAARAKRLEAATAKNKRSRVKQPRQGALIEDARITQLDNIGAAYADIRDQRIALNQEEHSLKQTALALMHKYGKTIYRHEAIEIIVSPGDESIKVKIKKVTEATAGAADTESDEDQQEDDHAETEEGEAAEA